MLPRAALMAGGIVLDALGGALYIGAGLGTGPRDALMTGLAWVTGLSLRPVRTGLELTVLGIGFILGARGGGDALLRLLIGPLVQSMLPWCVVELPHAHGRPRRVRTENPPSPG